MKAKKKICPTCGELKYLWNKSVGCKECCAANKPQKKPIQPRSPLRRVSVPRAKQIAVYRLKKKEFLMRHPVCQFPNCGRPSAIIHHRKHRENERLLDEEFWMALCGGEEPCHKFIHANPKESYEQGWLIKG